MFIATGVLSTAERAGVVNLGEVSSGVIVEQRPALCAERALYEAVHIPWYFDLIPKREKRWRQFPFRVSNQNASFTRVSARLGCTDDEGSDNTKPD